jgi:hypothetical protein
MTICVGNLFFEYYLIAQRDKYLQRSKNKLSVSFEKESRIKYLEI